MRTARTTLVAVATSTLLALTACGDSQTESEKAAEKYLQAVIDGDGETFCSLLEIEGQPIAENDEALSTCTEMSGETIPKMEKDERDRAEKLIDEGPEKAEEDGDKASVTYGTGDDAYDIELSRVDGDWFVTLA